MKKSIALLMSLILYTSLHAGSAIESKGDIAMRVWEHSRESYLRKTSLDGYEITEDDIEASERSESLSFILTLNCIKPAQKSRHYKLYEYRCSLQDKELLEELAQDDAYTLVASLPEHREKALSFIRNQILLSEKSEVDVGNREWLLEIEHFLKQGGYGLWK